MKKLIVSTGQLKQAFATLGLAILAHPTLPVIKNLLCKVTPKQLELVATNLDITIISRLECESKDTFEFLLPFDFINKIVGLYPNQPMVIESSKKVTLRIDTDQYDVSLADKVTNFPPLQDIPKKKFFEVGPEILYSLGVAVSTCGKNEDKPALMHVLMELAPSKVTIASSDGSYMVYSKEFESDQKEAQELLIRQNVIKALDGCESVKVFFHAKAIAFETEKLTVISTRSEDKFANFRTVFPPDWPANLTAQREDLMTALNKCALSSDTLKTTRVDLSNTEAISFSADDSMLNIHVSIAGQYTGTVQKTSVNADKFLKLLKQIEYSNISLALHKADKQIVITTPDDPGYKGMIMPIALPE